PAAIVQKKSSPRLWENHFAEDEIGMDYDLIDPILHLLVDKKMQPKYAARNLGVSAEDIHKVQYMIEKSMHKRRPAAIIAL
ncbi:MAG: NAD(+) synthetase, partial [Nitrososphaeraceae archaeon]|nr:NAD(+) synthetase [Nitrososphaeraceae archaeon]